MHEIKGLNKLIEKFNNSFDYIKSSSKGYNEYSCRIEFIDPLLELFGWDISNNRAVLPQFREVKAENYSNENDRPDYSMTLNGVTKFFIEAKKPSVDIQSSNDAAYQTRKYGWNAKHNIAVLTNFEYIIIFDTTIPPKPKDDCRVAVLKKYHYSQYEENFDEIYSLLSRGTVYSGKINEIFTLIYGGKMAESGLNIGVDEYFLKQINEWRLKLGNFLYGQKKYSIDVINDVIQEFINQIVFLRICEDRNLPLYHKLKETLKDENSIQNELQNLFINADKRYNSGLFSGKYIIFDLSNEIIKEIIEELYYPQSPYVFTLIEPNLLGEIYELFLSEYLCVDKFGKVVLSKKKVNNNRDVVTTPIEIVKKMVAMCLDTICKAKSPEEILKIKIVDIASGSGIFLIEVFDYIIKYCIEWYRKSNPEYLIDIENGQKKLPLKAKKDILTSCIFGIDIDVYAVEVTKFSLLLKLLEDETEPSVLSEQPILPDVTLNILHGNSLIDYTNIGVSFLDEAERLSIVPFEWSNINGGNYFDLIIGNPPYVNTEDMKNLFCKKEFETYKNKYQTAYLQFDKYYLFIERALEKINDNGYVCYIVPNKFSKIKSGEKLRKILSDGKLVREFIDFGSLQLFKDKTIYSSIIMLHKTNSDNFRFEEVADFNSWIIEQNFANEALLSHVTLSSTPWVLVSDPENAEKLNKLYSNSKPLSEYAALFNGIQTSAERPPVYWFSDEEILSEDKDVFNILKFGKEYAIEKSILKRYFKPVKKNEKNLETFDLYSANKWIIFPYDEMGKLIPKDIMSRKYKNTMRYLEDRYDLLKPKNISEDSSGRDVPFATKETWYQYGRDQALTSFNDTKKIIVGVLSKKPMYLFDENNLVIASGGTAGYCAISEKENSPLSLEYLQAYLTHPFTEWILSIIGSDFENDFYSRGTYVLNNLPIKKIDFNDSRQKEIYDQIVLKVKRIHDINERLSKNPTKKEVSVFLGEKESLKKQVENLVTKIYSV
jgi:type I restriction-modification system DNA methylase subunit